MANIIPHGCSFWTQTAQLETTLPDGTAKSYFLKVAEGENGRGMIRGEFEGVSLLYFMTPDFAPRPHAWGTYQGLPQFHFFLCDFQWVYHPATSTCFSRADSVHSDMTEELPEIESFTSAVARLHKASLPFSPGKYGFSVSTHIGFIAQDNSWCSTWEDFFRQSMVRMLAREQNVHGPWPKLDELCEQLYDKVIRRLLRPLTVLNHW